MQSTTILTVTKDAEWLIGMRPFLHATGRGRLVVAESIEEAERLLEFARPRLIVVDWKREDGSFDAITSLLWKNSIQGRPASVMIVAEDYRVDEATLLFQLGVDEYVGKCEHGEAMATVLVALTPETNGWSLPVWAHEYAGEDSIRQAEPAAKLGSIATAL
ncbi:response regulator transcription factor [Paludisphaera soli]|uniref:response regulator transcription factor n=1 Tax=Paludisphaera soli TaxID=2712865 RepID=UPI0013EB2478|nr:response regulator transcription factor [Paludisphaera soli]